MSKIVKIRPMIPGTSLDIEDCSVREVLDMVRGEYTLTIRPDTHFYGMTPDQIKDMKEKMGQKKEEGLTGSNTGEVLESLVADGRDHRHRYDSWTDFFEKLIFPRYEIRKKK